MDEALRQGALTVILARMGNAGAMARLYEDNLGKASSLASNFSAEAWESSDYRNAARAGLDAAIEHYCLATMGRDGEFSTFMFRVAQNRMKDVLRRKKRHAAALSTKPVEKAGDQALYDHAADHSEIEIQIWLESLSPLERHVANLLLAGMSRKDIKKTLPAGWNIKSLVARVQRSASNSFQLVDHRSTSDAEYPETNSN